MLNERAPKLHYVRFKDAAEKQKWARVLESMPKPQSHPYICFSETHTQSKSIVVHSQATALKTTGLERCSVLKDASAVTRPHRTHLVEWMKSHPSAIVLTADLTSSCEADLLRDTLPNQYLSMGMAEQNMMSFAGGLAREGLRSVLQYSSTYS